MSLDDLRATAKRRDLLTHSFYRRWVAGDLTISELRDYACQYAHVVEAIPTYLRGTAAGSPGHAAVLGQHADEEQAHVRMWADFATAIGVAPKALRDTPPNAATEALLQRGDALIKDGLGAAAVWALEAQTPAVSREKLEGLRQHYGIDAGAAGGRYFALHQTLDLEHAAELEGVIAGDGREAGAAAAADAMLSGLWDLLSSVEQPVAAAS